jgi:hypothetical protein
VGLPTLRRMPHHPLQRIPRPRQRTPNHGANSPPNVPSRRKLEAVSATQDVRNLKPAVKDRLAVARLHKHVMEAAHNPKRVAEAPLAVAQRQTLAMKETATVRPNHAKVKNGPPCCTMTIMAVAQALMMEIVVTNQALVTARNILRCIVKEIATAPPALAMVAKEGSLPIMAHVVTFTQIVARSTDLVMATLKNVTNAHPDHILTAGIAIMDAASVPTHVSVSAHSRPVAR